MGLLSYSLLGCLLVNAAFSIATIHEGGSCGADSIPYKITVDSDGKPEIYCQTPSCFGVDYSPRKSVEKDMSVTCDPFKEVVCVNDLQWTGGLLEVNNGTHRTLKTECCSYNGMSNAESVKSIFLAPGDIFVGGVVDKDDGGFDLIKEVRKTVNADNQVQYIIGVYRIPCLESSDSSEEYLPRLSRNKRKLRERLAKFDYYDDETRYRTFRRRPFAARRRALLQRLEDYYDYDYEMPAPRKPMRRSRLPYNENRLWPVQYNKPRAFSEQTYEDKSASMQDGSAGLASYAESSVESGPIPPPQSSSFIESQNVAPAQPNSYTNVQPGPAAPPVDTYAGAYQPASYPAYPSYPSSQYSGYPAQNSYAVAQPAAQPAYSYPSYPSYSPSYYTPNLNSIFSKSPFQCFSGDMEVETEDGPKLIKDLKIGDKVLSMDEALVTFSPVVMFLHKKHDEVAEFNLIETSEGHSIKLTDNHLIYISDCKANSDLKLVAAKDVKIGDCIHVTNRKNVVIKQKVGKMSKTIETGIYSPLTTTGDIIVNKVLASCHSNLALKSLQQTFFGLYKRTTNIFYSLVFFKTPADDGNLPFGIETLTSVIDLFVPQSFV